MTETNTSIRVSNLSKQYSLYQAPFDRVKEALHPLKKQYHRKFNALLNISFEVKKGEVLGIIGRNGSGKSTLLKLITSVLTPSSGELQVYGKISAILELGAGFNPELTGMENIYLNLSISGLSKEVIDSKVEELVAFAELGEFINQPIKTYSSGMAARLGFAVAINVAPDIFIVDEALSVGDAAFQRKCFAKMEKIRDEGATIIFVSHSDTSVVNLCDRAIWLHAGEKILDGVPKLVTGLYSKHIESKNIQSEHIAKEYTELLGIGEQSITKAEMPETVIQEQKNDRFNTALVSKSVIKYKENGAKISDVKITTLDGVKVNTVTQGGEYYFQYDVVLDDKDAQVLCAMLIKSIQGVNIGGGHYPERHTYQSVGRTNFGLKWKWKCRLIEGEYFVNCGVSDKNGFLHRIIDSVMFQVKNNDYAKQSYPMVDFIQSVECE